MFSNYQLDTSYGQEEEAMGIKRCNTLTKYVDREVNAWVYIYIYTYMYRAHGTNNCSFNQYICVCIHIYIHHHLINIWI